MRMLTPIIERGFPSFFKEDFLRYDTQDIIIFKFHNRWRH
jgi:hypothetical protein